MFNSYNECGCSNKWQQNCMPKDCCNKPEVKKFICFEEKNNCNKCNQYGNTNYQGYSNYMGY